MTVASLFTGILPDGATRNHRSKSTGRLTYPGLTRDYMVAIDRMDRSQLNHALKRAHAQAIATPSRKALVAKQYVIDAIKLLQLANGEIS